MQDRVTMYRTSILRAPKKAKQVTYGGISSVHFISPVSSSISFPSMERRRQTSPKHCVYPLYPIRNSNTTSIVAKNNLYKRSQPVTMLTTHTYIPYRCCSLFCRVCYLFLFYLCVYRTIVLCPRF
jgi:hypothetical protein